MSKGEYVYIKVPVEDKETEMLTQYNGEIHEVTKVKRFGRDPARVYYELEGCKSKKHIPYAFLRDWIARAGEPIGLYDEEDKI